MDVGACLRASRAAREAIVTDKTNTPLMSANASRLSTFKTIEQAISDAIISEDEIAELPFVYMEKVDIAKKVVSFANAKLFGKKYSKSF